ncbi:hypothetical protein GCM10011415_25160 [Salipiger pallidus]|uniref:Uncharacterized protein n=1 Tax=Salipiger pallidus TaxID=1775170 RepID=A0A8J2ZKC8_9RHOB|nr:hypothetical protein GCM10011415_25160 [Salipiger pallidus]
MLSRPFQSGSARIADRLRKIFKEMMPARAGMSFSSKMSFSRKRQISALQQVQKLRFGPAQAGDLGGASGDVIA